MVELFNYYTELAPDVDNVIKPILDGLKGVVFKDDDQVFRVTSERVSLLFTPSINTSSNTLAEALEEWNEVVYIKVSWKEEATK